MKTGKSNGEFLLINRDGTCLRHSNCDMFESQRKAKVNMTANMNLPTKENFE